MSENRVKHGDSRTMNFAAKDLPKDVSLCLMFTPIAEGELSKDMLPNCWKVLKLKAGITAGENQNAKVVYTADTGLLVPQVDSGSVISSGIARRCQTGERCELKTDEHGDNYLEAAGKGTKDVIQCKVDTEYPASVAFGIFNTEGTKLDPFCTWKDVAKGNNLSIKVDPTLKIYALSDYKSTRVVTSDLQNDALIEQNIFHLPPQSEFKVSVDHNSHAIKVEKVNKW
ncbi:hypothetical protein JR316_0012707 [Psilocybe cubensis]|uniref:Uncharacterized protein n=2 Tax=Psilocybe cubensis TaxID=181762 RepID=A0A8H7XNF4_PSICU|nr:hypothetical protein JR316_0012707 [Psilocybe cubensis]KAH9475590.1 hypothetical protein JR316_0012707 [Psilocybe cubensis]